ncbi:MAG: hypothetical protein ACPGGN_00660 [Opitutales bacterium]
MNLTDGTLNAHTVTGNVIQSAGFVGIQNLNGSATLNGGTLEAISVSGTVTNNGGIVAPGSSPAISTFGSYIQDGSATLEMEIGGTTAGAAGYDQLIVTGDTELAGTLDVILIDLGSGLFEPAEGDTFVLFDFQGTVTGWFDTVNLPDLAEGLLWLNDLSTTGTLTVVPEPSAYSLLVSLFALAYIANRRKM